MKVISALARKSWHEPPYPKGLFTTSFIVTLTMLKIKSSIFLSPINLAIPRSFAYNLKFCSNLATKLSLIHLVYNLAGTLQNNPLVVYSINVASFKLLIIFFNSIYCFLLAASIYSYFDFYSHMPKVMGQVHKLWIKKRSSLILLVGSETLEGTL